jgi:hypothetical protein
MLVDTPSFGQPNTPDREPRLCGRIMAAHPWEGQRLETSAKAALGCPLFAPLSP